jgi:hypothetical protein
MAFPPRWLFCCAAQHVGVAKVQWTPRHRPFVEVCMSGYSRSSRSRRSSFLFLPRTVAVSVTVAVASVSLLVAAPASGSVIFSGSGKSAAGTLVAFQAMLTISGSTGDDLTITLANTSPVDSRYADDVLSSFYFDIASGTTRPALSYASASGTVYQVRRGTTDVPTYYTPQTFTANSCSASNLRAVNNGDQTWQFRNMNQQASPFLGFGIGTVGNSNEPIASGNGFTPSIVGNGNSMINFSIYRGGDIDPQGQLNLKYLVRNTATFKFTGVSGYTEAAIAKKAMFGLGTGPDSTLFVAVPEPSGFAIAATGCLAGLGWMLHRRRSGRALTAESGGSQASDMDT